ncbi:F-box domain containing protein [Trema orientale]|uniref:F-box domain containing protein n=1 Tax=Trema orientale TaxID=63057 RepID=A0A2P5F2M6_TREOI|nr:F-box domain containing protein [Trema orientale]
MAPNNNNSPSPKRKSQKTEETSITTAGAYSKFENNASDALLQQIFVRLPDCRTAIQSSSVSKHWFSLISSPQFVRNFIHHRHSHNINNNNRHNQQPQQLLEHSASPPPCTFLIQGGLRDGRYASGSDYDRRYNFKFRQVFSEKSTNLHARSSLPVRDYLNFLPQPMVMAATYDDLLLLTPFPRSPCYYLCNPLTRKWTELPAAPFRGAAPSGVGLICQPGDCVDERLGCSNHAEYKFKVVLFYAAPFCDGAPSRDHRVRLVASIFCSETRQWSSSATSNPPRRTVPNDAATTTSSPIGHVVASNGVFYWLNDATVETLVVFDPFFEGEDDQKRWRFVKSPLRFYPTNSIHGGEFRLGVCGAGRVRAAQFAWYSPRVLKVWELEDNKSWRGVHDGFIGHSEYIVLGFKPNNGDAALLYSQDNHVFEYNIKEKRLERVGEFHIEANERRLDCVQYRYSVFPLVHPSWPTPIPVIPSI